MTKTNEVVKEYLTQLGKKGGKITKKNHGLNHFREIGRLGAEKRWGKKKAPAVDEK